jgi:hypothetical protein
MPECSLSSAKIQIKYDFIVSFFLFSVFIYHRHDKACEKRRVAILPKSGG